MKRNEKEQEIIKLYLAGKNCTEISKELDVQRKSIYRILKRNNIDLKKPIKSNCTICDKDITNNAVRNSKMCGVCNTKVRRYKIKKQAIDYLGGCCIECGWSGDLSGYDFHHRIPEEKSFNITARVMANKKWEEVKLELDKCDCLCALCHRFKHSDYDNEKLIAEATCVSVR